VVEPVLRVAIVAGEASGDALGAGLMAAIRASEPDAEFFGMAGSRMRAAGCAPWYRAEELSVMGLAEVLPHLRRLLALRRTLIQRIESARPDVFVGIDSPDFNLPIARRLKAAGIATVQYVSPQVWAWRQSRVNGIRRAVDRVLCVLPFEADFYAEHGVDARFVGHPLADEIPFEPDRAAARAALELPDDRPLVALLPGSRHAEVARLGRSFAETGAWLQRARHGLGIAVALANEDVAHEFTLLASEVEGPRPFKLVTGRAREVMTAADAVLTASGTATLEALLLKRPMVVAYRMTPFSYWLVRKLGISKLPHFSLPNLLAQKALVAEYVQEQVRADVLGPAILRCLDGDAAGPELDAEYGAIHRLLQRGGSGAAAAAVLELVHGRRE
jgi:lipid-A-disaccharide synthase